MSGLRDLLNEARRTGDFAPIIAKIPYAQFLGISVAVEDGDILGKLAYGDHIVGNPNVGALHGGTLGALLESTGIFKILWEADAPRVPKTVNITVEYLRSASKQDTFARAHFTRRGRRICNVRIVAWQDDPERPVAAATAHFLLEPPPG